MMADETGMKTRRRGQIEARQREMSDVQSDLTEVAQTEANDENSLLNDD
jgi:hypothetical protein